MIETILKYADEGAELRKTYFSEHAEIISRAASCIADSINNGGKILVCGNGGSAADAQHFAAELVGRFLIERHALPSIALTVDTSILTAVGNDYGYEHVFERQVAALGTSKDILVAISTSGNSENVLLAIEKAKEKSMQVIGLCGKSGGKMKNCCDILLHVKSDFTPFIQEMHEASIHLLCMLIDKKLFQK